MTTVSCHRATPPVQLSKVCQTADIIVSAAGQFKNNRRSFGDANCVLSLGAKVNNNKLRISTYYFYITSREGLQIDR